MSKEAIIQSAGQLVGAIVMSAGLVLGGAYAYKELVLDGQVQTTAQKPAEGYVVVSNQ